VSHIHDFCKLHLCLIPRSIKLAKLSDLFPKLQMLPIDNSKKSEKEKREIPRRRKPVVQERGHRVPELQAELREQGLQKLDNQ